MPGRVAGCPPDDRPCLVCYPFLYPFLHTSACSTTLSPSLTYSVLEQHCTSQCHVMFTTNIMKEQRVFAYNTVKQCVTVSEMFLSMV